MLRHAPRTLLALALVALMLSAPVAATAAVDAGTGADAPTAAAPTGTDAPAATATADTDTPAASATAGTDAPTGTAAAAGPTASTATLADCNGEGSLVVVGGGFDPNNTAVFRELIDLGGGNQSANVVIVPAASGVPQTSADGYERDFEKYGVPAENVTIAPLALKDDPNTPNVDESTWADNVDNQTVVNQLERATVVFYTGGAQHRVVDLLKDDDGTLTPAAQAIQGVYDDCGVVGGSSAGAAIMSQDMIGAGTSYAALREGVSYTDTYSSSTDNRPWLTEGMGYLDSGMVDQHFHQRGRLGRLVRTMWHRNADRGFERQTLGYGVGENTALVFENGQSTARVVGERGVSIVDLSNAQESDTSDADAIELRGVEVHYLTDGDVYDVANDTFTIDVEKGTDTVANPYYDGNAVRTDAFASNTTTLLLTEDLVDNTATSAVGESWGDGQVVTKNGDYGVRLTYTQDSLTEGYWGRYPDGVARYAALKVLLDIEPVQDSGGGGGGGGGPPPWAQ